MSSSLSLRSPFPVGLVEGLVNAHYPPILPGRVPGSFGMSCLPTIVGASPGRPRGPASGPGLTALDQIINPSILYGACVLGALGLALAMPRKGKNPQLIGALVTALAIGLGLIGLAAKAGAAQLPNAFFYIFAIVALGASLRVVTHPKPVYAALYFIMTILATAGLFLLLSAEFMAFSLIIVYAGAILITYLFVIMLASQAPEEGADQVLAGYDIESREPIVAAVVGFVILAALSTMMFRGIGSLPPPATGINPDLRLVQLPRKVEMALREAGTLKQGEKLVVRDNGDAAVEMGARTAVVRDGAGAERTVELPKDLNLANVEGLGFNLLSEHPGAIEIAGVILLMAMLGAVVLSRKQVQIDEDAKLRQVRRLSANATGGGVAGDAGAAGTGGSR
ncbi:MAG: NADH-quinone oxidoreductase subunit J [Planctomycetota bacterium]|nr:NADH-quinone oxidoreductase subunit J [Planctomycetota bacterium]